MSIFKCEGANCKVLVKRTNRTGRKRRFCPVCLHKRRRQKAKCDYDALEGEAKILMLQNVSRKNRLIKIRKGHGVLIKKDTPPVELSPQEFAAIVQAYGDLVGLKLKGLLPLEAMLKPRRDYGGSALRKPQTVARYLRMQQRL